MSEASATAPGVVGSVATDEAPFPKPAYAWYVVAVLLLAYTLSFLDRTILSLLIAPLRAELHISDTQVSLLLGFAFAVFYTLLGVPLGWAADRHNRRGLIAAGIALWSAMTALCVIARSFTVLFALRVGVGVGEATLSPAAYSLLSDYFPKAKLGRAIAIYSIGVPLGSGLALALGAFVIKLVLGAPPLDVPLIGAIEPWRLTFFCVGAPGLIAALLMLTVREPIRRGRRSAASSASGAIIPFLRSNAAALSFHMLGMSAFVLVVYGFMAWAPTFFARTYAISAPDAGLRFGIITAICGAGGLVFGGWIADRLYRKGLKGAHMLAMRSGALALTVLFGLAPLAPTAWTALAILAPAMFVASIPSGIAGAALQLISPNQFRAQITALYFFLANLIGLGLGPTLIALITDYGFRADGALRYSMALVAVTVLPLSSLVLSLGIKPFAKSLAAADSGWPSLI